MPSVYVFGALVTYRAPELIKRCMASLEGQLTAFFIKDTSLEPDVLYTAGINAGIRRGLKQRAKYILVCCDDVIVGPKAVAQMASFMDENPECGIAMPLQVSADGTVNCGGCTVAFPYGKHVNEPLGHDLYKAPYESYWANGACFLLRSSTVKECGLLDENMRFICSDSDYSFTVRSRGWKIYVVPEARVEHAARGALATDNVRMEKIKDEDHLYFIKKWLIGGVFRELSAEGATLDGRIIGARLNELQHRLANYPDVELPRGGSGAI